MKKIFILLAVFIVTLSHETSAAVLQSSFKVNDKKEIMEGDVVSGVLKIATNSETNFDFAKLEGKLLFNSLKLEKVTNVTSDGITSSVEGVFFVSSADVKKITELSEDGSLELEIDQLNIKSFDKKDKNLFVAEQSLGLPWGWIAFSVFIALGIIAALLKLDKIKEIFEDKEKKKIRKLEKFLREAIKSAEKRKDYEVLYLNRQDWKHLVNNELALDKFVKEINKYQYRPVWENHELDDVRSSFEDVRRSLK